MTRHPVPQMAATTTHPVSKVQDGAPNVPAQPQVIYVSGVPPAGAVYATVPTPSGMVFESGTPMTGVTYVSAPASGVCCSSRIQRRLRCSMLCRGAYVVQSAQAGEGSILVDEPYLDYYFRVGPVGVLVGTVARAFDA